MKRCYIAIPENRRHEIPPTVLPTLRDGECSDCSTKVIFHGLTFDGFAKACQQANQEPIIVCPQCAAKHADSFDGASFWISPALPNLKRDTCKG